MAIFPHGHSPAASRPTLRDGAGGTSERPSAQASDPILRTVGWRTSGIRLTAGGIDVSAGNSAVYNFGNVNSESVGRYYFSAQSAANALEGTHPLGAVEYHHLEIREESAGLFKIDSVLPFDGLAALEDDVQEDTNQVATVYLTDKDTPVFTTTNGDSDVVWTVLTATTAATLDALADIQGGALKGGDLVLVETRSTTTEVWAAQRLS